MQPIAERVWSKTDGWKTAGGAVLTVGLLTLRHYLPTLVPEEAWMISIEFSKALLYGGVMDKVRKAINKTQ